MANKRGVLALERTESDYNIRWAPSDAHYISQSFFISYAYEPLDTTKHQIRLIRLRRDTDGPIRADISIFALEDAPKYCALSYTWGLPGLPCYVFLNGKRIEIRNNLHQCLQKLREEEEGGGYLWIDQICINQSDVLERNAQVALMSTIYTQCSSVIIWLGSEDSSIYEAARKINRMNITSLRQRMSCNLYDRSVRRELDSLHTLLNHGYFRRVWIVQEVILAEAIRVLCKGHTWLF
jgi:hypothetical protein